MCRSLAMAYINHHGELRAWDGRAYTEVLRKNNIYLGESSSIISLHALSRRGLVYWLKDDTGDSFELHCTQAGVKVLELVLMAGILPDNWVDAFEDKRQWLADTEEKRQELLATRKVKPAKQEVAI